MPIFNGVDNIANIYHGNNQIVKVYQGANLKYELLLFGLYEEIADVIVTSNTTQIDFNNLNITKNDELRLVYTFNDSSCLIHLFSNSNTTQSNYWFQVLEGNGSGFGKNRVNANRIAQVNSDFPSSGFADIKISNNDKYVVQSQLIQKMGSGSSNLINENYNMVGTQTISNINKLSVVASLSNGIATGSRLTLYKVNTGNA